MSSIKTISFSNYMDANATPFVNQKRKTAYPKLKGKRTKFKAPSTKLKFVGSSPIASLSQSGNRNKTNVRYKLYQEGGYTVKKGDTLWALGQKYGVNWQNIAKENNISDPRMLRIGTVLNIPGQSQKSVVANQSVQQPKQQNITYTAQGPEITVTASKPNFRENQTRPQTNLQAARAAYTFGNPIPSVMPQSRPQRSENALEQLLSNSSNLVQTPEPIVKESTSQPQENVTPIAKTLAELPKGLTRNSSIRPTVSGSYRSGNVGVDAMKKFKNENPNVKTIVYLKGPLENKKGSQGIDANVLREMGYDVKVLPIGRLSGEGEKANFRKAVDMVKQGNVLVMCEHGYDRTGAVCAQAALESGYDMNTVIDHNVWRENDRIYPYVSGKGSDYAPYFDNLVLPKQQMGGSTTNIPPTRVTHDRIVQTINDMSAQGKSYDEIMGNIDNLLLLRDKQQKTESVQKDMMRAQQSQKYWIDDREVSEEEYNKMAQQFPDRYPTSVPKSQLGYFILPRKVKTF